MSDSSFLLPFSQTPEVGDTCKTWDGPSGSLSSLEGSELDLESVQRSFTAPDRTGIRIYYSPPAVRRMEPRRGASEAPVPVQTHNGTALLGPGRSSESAVEAPPPQTSFSSSYEQWLSSLSKQHRELLESRTGAVSLPGSSNINGSSGAVVDGMSGAAAFHGLEIGEISANLSDDMKEMTNCVRQAIRSSSLERKSSKDPGGPVGGVIQHQGVLPPINKVIHVLHLFRKIHCSSLVSS